MDFAGRPVSVAAYDVLWEWAMPGVTKPAVLHSESPGGSAQQRGKIVDAARTELARAGYAGPGGVANEVAALLDGLARPWAAVDVRLYEWIPVHGTHSTRLARFGARITASEWRGAGALLGPDQFRAWSFPAGSLVDEVIRFFVPHPAPARFSGFFLRPDELALRPARRGEAVLRALEGPYLRRAHICAVSRDPVAGSHRVSQSLVLNDVAAGRYLVFMARNEVTVAPGNRGVLERKLKELLEPGRRM